MGYSVVVSTFLKKYGLSIKGYRKLKGYTQEELAEKVDVTLNTIGLWENGKSFLEYPNLQKLCKALEISEEDLFGFAGKSSKSKTPYNEIVELSKKLTPSQQQQLIEIIKTFIS